MGQLSFDTIVSEGLLKAGKEPSTLSTRAGVWLNMRNQTLEKGWAWPWLQRRIDNLALSAGTESLTFGAGAGGEVKRIKLIRSPILVYRSDFTVRTYAHVEDLQGTFGDVGYDPLARQGTPLRFKVRADNTIWGRWVLRSMPVANRDVLLAVDYQVMSDTLSGSDIPMYPNDRTLIAAVVAEAMAYLHGVSADETQAAEDEFSALASRDRAEYGGVPGTNDMLGLDPSVFK